MRNNLGMVCAASSLVLVGCIGTKAQLDTANPVPSSSVPVEQVHVFLPEAALPTECVQHAVITAWGDAVATTRNQMIASVRSRAAKVGANAVRIDEMRGPSTARVLVSFFWPSLRRRESTATAYRCPPDRLHPVRSR